MTQDTVDMPPVGGTPVPAPETAREDTSPLEALPVPEAAPHEEEMSALTEPLSEETPEETPEPPPALELSAEPDVEPEIPLEYFDPDALKVIHRLLQHGYEAYFVGGCVRDLLLGRKPKDFDIATSAHPQEVRDLFRNCRLIGRRFRLAHVYFKGGKIIEVSTFRANPLELDTGDDEHVPETEEELQPAPDLLITQDNVFGNAEQDARRRDFTINGLFYDVTRGQVIDYVRGRRDLDEHYIRTIGDPEIRMREDPVRILRAVRFACKLGLDIESRTYAAMEGAVEDLPRCAPPRLLEETFRLIRSGIAAPSLRLLQALDALRILLPPVAAYMREHGRQGAQSFYAFAEAMDRRVQAAGEPLDDALLLAALLVPIARAAPQPELPPDPGAPPHVAKVIEDLLGELVQSARLPRRIAERCRMLLVAQRTLSGERRRRLGGFLRHPLFHEALAVFELTVEATGQQREVLEAWKRGQVPSFERSEQAESEPSRRKRRRRRRRRGEGGASAAGPAAAEGSQGAEAEEEDEGPEGDSGGETED